MSDTIPREVAYRQAPFLAYCVGDRGQRYEVRQCLDSGESVVWGWTEEADGGALAEAARLHPDTFRVAVVDRFEEDERC